MIVLDVIAVVLVADFVSGFFHWMEDAYGREHWPVTGALITRPNVLHHHEPRYFSRHSWPAVRACSSRRGSSCWR